MSANLIVFDAQYTSEQVKSIERVQRIVQEAISTLKNASAHTGWKCPETTSINNSMGTITQRLGNLNQGMEATIQALKKGTQRFQELETRAENQTTHLSNNLNKQNGFSASVRGKNETTNLPVTQVPNNQDSFEVGNILKGFARKAIQGTCNIIGGIVGAVKNGVEGITRGLITDIKEGVVDKVVNIFESSYKLRETLAEPPYDDTTHEIVNIVANSIGLFGTVTGLQAEVSLFRNLGSFPNETKFLNIVNSKSSDILEHVSDEQKIIEDIYLPSSYGEDTNQAVLKMFSDSLVPFGLDETLIQGVQGIAEGAKAGGETGNIFANVICNFLGL